MSFTASHIATIPASGFKWYLIFLEGPLSDGIRKQIDEHFIALGRETGRDVLVVRGFDPTPFRDSVYEASAFFDEKWRARARFPALIVTNLPPADALSDVMNLEKGKVMIFPLAEVCEDHGSLSGFLTDIVSALKEEDAITALETLDKGKLEKGWRWLAKYTTMEPGFFGFNVKLDAVISGLLARKAR